MKVRLRVGQPERCQRSLDVPIPKPSLSFSIGRTKKRVQLCVWKSCRVLVALVVGYMCMCGRPYQGHTSKTKTFLLYKSYLVAGWLARVDTYKKVKIGPSSTSTMRRDCWRVLTLGWCQQKILTLSIQHHTVGSHSYHYSCISHSR